jgi:hypothetical protein
MNKTGPIRYIKEDMIGIIIVIDHAAEPIFNLQIVILAEDIISSEIPA